ncbi:MAG: pyridoxal 5'-phosphate synthase glutaminase subunit PdxT [Candidatus Nanopelagicales bacterium]
MVTKPLIGVLALQGDVREHRHALEACGADVLEVRTRADLERVDGLVFPGGESTTMSKLAVAFGLIEPLRAALRSGLPAYGSCAGLIMLADRILDGREDQQTVGGLDVVVRRNAFGRQVDSFEADLHAPRIVGVAPMRAVFIRAPWVEAVGPAVEVLARVEGGPRTDTIVAVQQGNVMATSFHPEITADLRVHEYFVNLVRG